MGLTLPLVTTRSFDKYARWHPAVQGRIPVVIFLQHYYYSIPLAPTCLGKTTQSSCFIFVHQEANIILELHLLQCYRDIICQILKQSTAAYSKLYLLVLAASDDTALTDSSAATGHTEPAWVSIHLQSLTLQLLQFTGQWSWMFTAAEKVDKPEESRASACQCKKTTRSATISCKVSLLKQNHQNPTAALCHNQKRASLKINC